MWKRELANVNWHILSGLCLVLFFRAKFTFYSARSSERLPATGRQTVYSNGSTDGVSRITSKRSCSTEGR